MATINNDVTTVVLTAAYYNQKLIELTDDKVTGPGITLDLDEDIFVVTKEE